MSKILFDYSTSYKDTHEYDQVGPYNNVVVTDYKKPINGEIFFGKHDYCPFCKMQIPNVFHNLRTNTIGVELVLYLDVWECPNCGWWSSLQQFSEEEDWLDKISTKNWDTHYHGILKKYKVSDKLVPISTLIMELEKKKDILYNINPYKLEEMAQHVFSAYYNCKVEHIGKTGDGGIDLLIIDSDDPILVQVKRRTSAEHVELVAPIREFVGAMFLKNSQKGIYLSTASHFSKGSLEIQNTLLRERNFELFELIDFDKFIKMMNVLKKDHYKPWYKIVQENGFDIK
jgi:HJR/Mrr/RecB family endonuclease